MFEPTSGRRSRVVRRTLASLVRVVLLSFVAACGHAGSADAVMVLQDGAIVSSDAAASASAAPPAPIADDASSPTADQPDAGLAYDDQDPTALQDFHPALDAHGAWTDDPTYGTVWVPSSAEVGVDFVPYVSGGHWVYGDDYLWVSDFDWGWAPFHYGRWVDVPARGWAWIPGREYAPAWVEWRTGGAYVGWAPAPPLFVWRAGIAVTLGFALPAPRYSFCAHADIFASRPGRVVILGPRALEIERRTRVYAVRSGPGHCDHGPPPASLHIPPDRVVRCTGREPDLVHAREFSHPATARLLGAHPPEHSHEADEPHRFDPEHGQVEREPQRDVLREDPARHAEVREETHHESPTEVHREAPHAVEHHEAPHVEHPPAEHAAPMRSAAPRKK